MRARTGLTMCGVVLAAAPAFGQLCFEPREVGSASRCLALEAGDLNGDGAMDFVAAADGSGQILLFESDGASPAGYTSIVIDGAAGGPKDLLLFDLDGDTDLDVIGASSIANRVAWYERISPRTFLRRTISGLEAGARAVAVGDINGDGLPDVVSAAAGNDTVAWHEALPGAVPSFVRHVVSSSVGDVETVAVADLDGDGDMDIAAGDKAVNDLLWFENDGMDPPSFTQRTAEAFAFNLRTLTAGDLNGDGDVDLVAGGSLGSVEIYTNNGASPPAFTRTQALVGFQPEELRLFDFDGDADPDIVGVSRNNNELWWFENDGAASPVFAPRFIERGGPGLAQPRSVAVADMDGDLDPDVVVGSNFGQIGLLERVEVLNADSGMRFPSLQSAVDSASANDALVASPTHFDLKCAPALDTGAQPLVIRSTGDLVRPAGTSTAPALFTTMEANGDIVIEGELSLPVNSAVVFRAIGGAMTLAGRAEIGDFSGFQVLEGDLDLVGRAAFAPNQVGATAVASRSVAAGDLNGDGHIDIVTGGVNGQIVWHEHDGSPEPQFTAHPIPGGGSAPESIDLADADGDGDLDLVTSSPISDMVYVFENDGAALPAFTETPYPGGDRPEEAVFADLDGDGDLDVAWTSSDDATVRWLENMGSGPLAYTPRVLSTGFVTAISIAAADLDSDGDVDVVSYSDDALDGGVWWFENDGQPNPSFARVLIDPVFLDASGIDVADLDGDGDLDVVTSDTVDFGTGSVNWFRNNGAANPGFARVPLNDDVAGNRSVEAVDLDGDGDLDLVCAADGGRNLVWFENDGAPSPGFTLREIDTPTRAGFAAAIADIDADGGVDIVVTMQGTTDGTQRGAVWHENILADGVELLELGLFETFGSMTLRNKTVRVSPSAEISSAVSVDIDRNSTVFGSGGVVGPVIRSAGRIRPAQNTGMILEGAYTQSLTDVTGFDTGDLVFDLGDGDDNGEITFASAVATIDGGLIVSADPGLTLEEGDRISLAIAEFPVAGRFDVALLPGLTGDLFLRVEYNGGDGGGGGGASPKGGFDGSIELVVDALSGDIDLDSGAESSLSGLPTSAALGDIDGDGLPDLAVTIPDPADPRGAPGSVSVLLNGGNMSGVWQGFSGGTTQITVGVNPVDVEIGQIDGEPGLDIAVVNRDDGTVSFLLNSGAAVTGVGLTLAFNVNPVDGELVDLDGNGSLDVVVAGEDQSGAGVLTVALNTAGAPGADPFGRRGGDGGGGGWGGLEPTQDTGVGASVRAIDCGDLDDDGATDIGAVTTQDEIIIGYNQMGGTGGDWNGLGAQSGGLVGEGAVAIRIEQVDGSGPPDIVTANEGDGTVSVILNEGARNLAPAVDLPSGAGTRSIVLTDLDADGDRDLAVVADSASGGREVRTLRNDLSGGQVVFAPAETIGAVGNPVLVEAGDVDGQNGEDLVVVSAEDAGGMGASAGGTTPRGTTPRGSPPGNAATGLLNTGAAVVCRPDLAPPVGALDFNDVVAFLTAFGAGESSADFAPPKGVLDFNDVIAFLTEFGVGCP